MVTVSVIVPTYKRIDQTIRTLTLLGSSTGINHDFRLERIVSDSTPDSTLKERIASVFGSQVVYTKPPTPGIAANKNQGARVATSPILIFCDSDIEVEPETLGNTISSLARYTTAAAVGGQVVWKGGEVSGQLDRPRNEDRRLAIGETTYAEAIYSRYIATYKPVFWEVGGYDEEVFNMRGEGSDLSVRYWRAGYPLVFDELIKAHHVYTAADAAAVRIAHSEWGIAKDLILLAYKYDMTDRDYANFTATVGANFKKLGEAGFGAIVTGAAKYLDFISESATRLRMQKQHLPKRYDFKFLEIFSEMALFEKCLAEAKEKLAAVKREAHNV